MSRMGSSALAGLEAQAAALTTQVNKYDQQIQFEQAAIQSHSPSSPIAQADTQLLGSLTTAQSNASLQLQSVNSQIAAAKLNNAATNGGTEVIQHASSATGPSLLSQLLPIAFGAVLGLIVGGAYVVIRQRRSNLTTRDEIAAAAGVPVVLSSAVERLSRSSDWLTLLREHAPSKTELWNVRKVLSYLDVPEVGRRVLTVITLTDDSASMAAVAHFAVASAAMDIPTSLVLTSDDSGSRGLSDACDLLTARNEAARHQLRLFKGSAPVDETESALTIISIVLSPDQPKLPVFVARGMVFLALSAGFVGEEQLARILIAVGQEGQSVEGLFVTNPMSADRTLGSLPNTNEQVTRFLQSRALEPWTGNAGRTVTTMREGPALPDLGGIANDPESVAAPPNTSPEGQPPIVLVGRLVSLRFVMGVLRRRRKIWLSAAAVGLVIGLGYHLVVPRSYSAHATLYLAQAPGTDPAAGMENDIALLETSAVGHRAADLLG